MRIKRILCCGAVVALSLSGCGGDTSAKTAAKTPPVTSQSADTPVDAAAKTTAPAKDDAGHSHERGKMMLADASKHHALLTAHLSPKGNELDLFFETAVDKNPVPVALPLPTIRGFASRPGEDKPQELAFEPAPADERPKGEKAGTCSHYVAKAPWMKPADELTVAVTLELDGERHRVTFEKFNPKKYAHHEE